MMFKSASVLFSALLASASLVSAAPATKTSSPVVNIVYNPMITYPTAGVIWTVGQSQQITWNTAEIPDELKNSTGTILLGYEENDSENLNIAQPLATGFKLTDGQVNVTVPDTPERSDYIVVLFGDSGNASPEFTIEPADSSSVSASASATATAPATVSSASASASDGILSL